MLRVLVESPFAGDRDTNLRYLRSLMLFCAQRGEAPYASHAYIPTFLDDDDPVQRLLGIEMGLLWGACAHKTVVGIDLGMSTGMRMGILRARTEKRAVEVVSLQDWRQVSPTLIRQSHPELILPGDTVTIQLRESFAPQALVS